MSTVDYSKVKVKSSNNNYVEDRYIKRADRLKDLQDVYNAIFDELCAVEGELGERMKRLNPSEYKIIYERYIHGVYHVSIRSMAHRLGRGYSEDMVKKAQ